MPRKVGIVIGSDSDLPSALGGCDLLEQFGVEYEIRVLSAHRTPEEAVSYAASAHENGFGVIISGAGLAAHLPGVIAAHTLLPVIGVPVESGALGGVDALYSIVQMPPGIPVACVGVGAFRNAALLATQILAQNSTELTRKLAEYRRSMRESVLAKDTMLSQKGIRGYLAAKHTQD